MEGWSELVEERKGGREGRQKGTESDLEVGRACAHLQPCVASFL